MDIKKDKSEEIFDYESNYMGVPDPFEKQQLITKEESRMRSVLDLNPKGKVLDIGCGAGFFIESLKHYCKDIEAYGCDISHIAISEAKKRNLDIEFDVTKDGKLPYDDNFFDYIICMEVLEHVPDMTGVLKEMRRVIKPNGIIHISVATEGQIGTLFWFFSQIHFFDYLTFKYWGHIHPELDHMKMVKLIKENGFSITDIKYGIHIFSQVLNFFSYFLPKEVLSLIIKDDTYTDRWWYENKDKESKSKLYALRYLYSYIVLIVERCQSFEFKIFERISSTASRMFVTYTVKEAQQVE